jgi:hypothetical protein
VTHMHVEPPDDDWRLNEAGDNTLLVVPVISWIVGTTHALSAAIRLHLAGTCAGQWTPRGWRWWCWWRWRRRRRQRRRRWKGHAELVVVYHHFDGCRTAEPTISRRTDRVAAPSHIGDAIRIYGTCRSARTTAAAPARQSACWRDGGDTKHSYSELPKSAGSSPD